MATVSGWRGLGRFWLLIAGLLAIAGVVLEVLGPPARPPPTPVAAASPPKPVPVPAAARPAASPQATPVAQVPPAQQPGRGTPGPIADPDPALQEPVEGSTTDLVPRVGEDGRMPMQVYAAGFDRTSRRPRIGLLVAGIGLNQVDSDAAIRSLPGGVTLAISPYAQDLAKLLAAARLAEHEYLVSIPMEPQGYPLNDPGPQALMTNLSREQNHPRLEWALSRFAGYVGATGALGSLRGERFASLSDDMQPVLAELARRGLLYVDARPGAAPLPLVWDRGIDLVVDEPDGAANIDDKLAQLAKLAHDKGSALGLVTAPAPVAVHHIVAWADGLTAEGLILAPVSALVRPPAKEPAP